MLKVKDNFAGVGFFYITGMVVDDVDSFLVAEMLPKSVGCEDDELIFWLESVYPDRRLRA